jgi:FtsP/CotA-like multicopper oxidase with cupredoxin domain
VTHHASIAAKLPNNFSNVTKDHVFLRIRLLFELTQHDVTFIRRILAKHEDGGGMHRQQNCIDAAGGEGGERMSSRIGSTFVLALIGVVALPVVAQSFKVQCPTSTITHPDTSGSGVNNAEKPYTGPTHLVQCTAGATIAGTSTKCPASGTFLVPNTSLTVNGAIKCQQISGGDGFATMGDGSQTYLFSFGPLSGLADIAAGNPGTQYPNVFNTIYSDTGPVNPNLAPGDPATTGAGFNFNGAVGLAPDVDNGNAIDGHVDVRQIMDVGVMNGNIPAPLMAIDEDDEFFLTLSNVGMIMRPDLFEQHTVHFHGYPNASAFYDGVPDASVAINIGGSFTYYYLAPDAGTYFWHCHITPPEHLQMGMVGQIYVRPRQNRVAVGNSLFDALALQQGDPRTACNSSDIVCTNPTPNGGKPANPATRRASGMYAYNDGDGTTYYDVEYPIQIHGFDPNFHFVGMTFNPEGFADMKDKYFLLNGRSYPDTVTEGPMQTVSADGVNHFSQPLPAVINIPLGGKALLRISDLDVSEFQTLASLGIPMNVVGYNAKLLRDQEGTNMNYKTNSITLGGGESLDVILDASDTTKYAAGKKFFLYTPNLDHLANDAENFGGLMTEVNICMSVDPTTKACVNN